MGALLEGAALGGIAGGFVSGMISYKMGGSEVADAWMAAAKGSAAGAIGGAVAIDCLYHDEEAKRPSKETMQILYVGG